MIETFVNAMLGGARSSDELHDEVVERRRRREVSTENWSDRALVDAVQEEARAEARELHGEIEHAVDWIEAHPQATQYEVTT